jgi:hypothetical protein
MPLYNRGTTAIYWRAFNPYDPTRGLGRPGFEGTPPVGGSVTIALPLPNFQLEVGDLPPLSLIPPSRIGPLFTPDDVISFDGVALRLETQIARCERFSAESKRVQVREQRPAEHLSRNGYTGGPDDQCRRCGKRTLRRDGLRRAQSLRYREQPALGARCHVSRGQLPCPQRPRAA